MCDSRVHFMRKGDGGAGGDGHGPMEESGGILWTPMGFNPQGRVGGDSSDVEDLEMWDSKEMRNICGN